MVNELLNFFYERSDLLKSAGGFTQSDDSKWVAKFSFIVSNVKTDEENTIELNSTEDLETAVKEYFSNTVTDFTNKIVYSKFLNENNKMFVHLMLP